MAKLGSREDAILTESTELLFRFTNAADTPVQRAALIDLIKSRRLHKVASDESFRNALKRLAHSTRDAASEPDRLLTVAALQHAAATAPPVRPLVESLLSNAVAGPLSKLYELPEVRDRLYAAKSWRVVPEAWCLDDLAAGAAREESGEAVRKECIEGMFELAGQTEEAIAALRKALLALKFETKKPSDSFGRRLIRVLAASTDAISRSDKPVGENAGREVSRLLSHGFRATGRPDSPAVRTAVVEQVAVATHAIVRADFSQGCSAKTYEALSVVKHWFSAHKWQELCKSSTAVSRVRDDVRKALVLLAGAGKTDDLLRRALVTAAGSRENADAICRTLATEHPGIPDDVRDWLAGVSKRTQSASAAESQERAIDEVVAELLVAMTRLSRASEVVQSDVLPDVSIVLPQSVHALSRLTGMADAMANTLSLAVKWRSLRMRGTVGQEVEFSPVEHQFSSSGTPTRRVRLLSPVVERLSEDGVPRGSPKGCCRTDPGSAGDGGRRVTMTYEAKLLLKNLLARLDADAATERPQFRGVVSDIERDALRSLLEDQSSGTPPPRSSTEPVGRLLAKGDASAQRSAVDLKTKALRLDSSPAPHWILSLDFGTAKSKAFAATDEEDPELLPLPIGKADEDLDGSVHEVSSSVWIADDGRLFVGSEAVRRGMNLGDSARRRLDSLKQQISQVHPRGRSGAAGTETAKGDRSNLDFDILGCDHVLLGVSDGFGDDRTRT